MIKALLSFGLLASAVCFRASAQYSIDWFKVSGGGGTSTGSVYSVTGTIGQHDADGPMTGGKYSLTGGFWSLIFAVQPPGAPPLSITLTTSNAVLISWPYPSTGFGLEQNGVLGTTNWVGVTNAPVQVGEQLQVMLSPLAGNSFYRLHSP
jgi:hypothetical protein